MRGKRHGNSWEKIPAEVLVERSFNDPAVIKRNICLVITVLVICLISHFLMMPVDFQKYKLNPAIWNDSE